MSLSVTQRCPEIWSVCVFKGSHLKLISVCCVCSVHWFTKVLFTQLWWTKLCTDNSAQSLTWEVVNPESSSPVFGFSVVHTLEQHLSSIASCLFLHSMEKKKCWCLFPYHLDLPMEYNPSDHPRASTIFLSKSQTDGEFCSVSSASFTCSHSFFYSWSWWAIR